MALEFTYNRNAVRKTKLVRTCHLSMIEFVFRQLDDCHKQRFQSSCFKNLQKLRSTNVECQLFRQLLMRQVQTSKTNEIWFKFKDKISRFGLQEFTLITGLNAGDLDEEVVEGKTVPRLLKNYFSNQKICRKDLVKAFCECNNPEDKYKLGLLVCLVSVLLGAARRTLLNPWLFFIVEDVDKFNKYPWGKKSFLYTIKTFKRKPRIRSNESTQKKDSCLLHGFPLAVMIWGLEAIPSLGKRFADSIGERVPRMLSWKLNDRILSSTVDKFLESEKYNVIRKMEPTEAEKAETFWQELTHLDDKEDSRVDNKDDFEDNDESVSGDVGNDAEDGEYDSLSNEGFPPETQLDGNQTLLENRIGMESTPLLDPRGAGIIKNLESPQSAPAQVNVTSQGRYKATENRIMALEFAYNRDAVGKANLSCMSNLSMIEPVFTQLDDCHKQRFQSSCFKNLLKLRSTAVGYQLFHQLLLRQVQTDKTMEVWFKFNGMLSRFGLQEFTLITGLNAGDLEDEVVEKKTVPRLLKNYFSNSKCKGKVNRTDLLEAFCKCNNPEDKYKLGLLVCLAWVLLGAAEAALLNPWLFFIVEDVDRFNNYPWGKKAFLCTIKTFKGKLKTASDNPHQKKDVYYNLQGFPLAVMIWGLEAIPSLGKRFADSIGERVPRMLSWKLKDRILSSTVDKFLESEEYNVIRKMEPTEAEKAETFWQELTHLDDKEDSRVDNKDDFEDNDESVSGDVGNDAEDGEYDSLSNEGFPPETQLDGNQTLLENHIGMESTPLLDPRGAGIIKNRESPQSAPAQVNVTSQGRYKATENRVMALEFTYNRNDVGKTRLTCMSNLSTIEFVFRQLDDCHKQRFQSSCFKNLQKLSRTNVGYHYQLFHQLLMRQVQTGKTNEIWFKFKDKISRFGLQEFTLITGLNAGDLDEEVVEGKTVPRLLKNYFSNQKIYREDLMKAFCKCNNPEDKYKLGLLVCLVSVLLGAQEATLLNPWLFFIVEDVDKFNNYPWGKKSFLYTIKHLNRKLEIESNKSPQKKDVSYRLYGFPLAVMIWGLEAIPSLGKRFADSIGERVPRMLSWKLKDRILSSTVDKFLESEEYNVIRKMEPTEAEKAETFWQELTHLDDKEDSRVDNKDDFEDNDESVSGDVGNDAEDGEYDSLSNEGFPPETQLDGNQTLLENHIGMESPLLDPRGAGIIKNRESPQSAPAQVNVTSQGRYKLHKRPAPQLAPEQNKRARLAFETPLSSICHSTFHTSDGEMLPDKTYEAKLDNFALCQAKAAAALNELMPEFRSRPPSSVLSELENLKREIATALSKDKEQETIISGLRHENTELSSRCASLVAEEKNTKEELTISRTKEKELESIISRLRNEITELSSENKKTKEELMVSRSKEKELEASNSRLTHENATFSAQCAFEAEYKRTIQELTVARSKEKEQEAAIFRLTHKNKVFSAECSSYESQIVALEAEYKKTKEELSNADRKFYSEARAAGYAEGVKEGKSKWLKSAEFLDSLTDASVKYFDYGFDSCQKQAEQQGFVGKLDKDSALSEALNSKQILD